LSGPAADPRFPVRDVGPYSARNTSKGALLDEAARVVAGLVGGRSLAELRADALRGDLLRQTAYETRRRIWDALHFRLFAHGVGWVVEDLKRALVAGPHCPEFVSLVYLHFVLRDRLTFDVVTDVVWERWQNAPHGIGRHDVLALLDRAAGAQPQIMRWTDRSRRTLAGSILTALRDFGLLRGSQRKTVVRPPLPLATAEHVVRLLTCEGVRGQGVLLDPTWRLFLLSEADVAHQLALLSRERRLRFERGGAAVVLETPAAWEAER
jgi:hypothetical protein